MNNRIGTWIVGIVALVALGLSVYGVSGSGGQTLGGLIVNDNPVFTNGLRAGLEEDQIVSVDANFVNPTVSATSTGAHSGKVVRHTSELSSSSTLTAAQIAASNYFEVDTAQSGGVQLTLPTVNAGDVGKEVFFMITSSGNLATNTLDIIATATTSPLVASGTTAILYNRGEYARCIFYGTASSTCAYYGAEY